MWLISFALFSSERNVTRVFGEYSIVALITFATSSESQGEKITYVLELEQYPSTYPNITDRSIISSVIIKKLKSGGNWRRVLATATEKTNVILQLR